MIRNAFPLSLVPVPQGWHLVILVDNVSVPLLKPNSTANLETPYRFESQQQAWELVKELFELHVRQVPNRELLHGKIRTCSKCNRPFRAKHTPHCHHCQMDNDYLLQQLWPGFTELFEGLEDSEENTAEKIRRVLHLSEEQYCRVPIYFQETVQQPLVAHEEQLNRKPKADQQLIVILKSRLNARASKKSGGKRQSQGLHIRRD
jgi:hypothetical protein